MSGAIERLYRCLKPKPLEKSVDIPIGMILRFPFGELLQLEAMLRSAKCFAVRLSKAKELHLKRRG